MLWVIQYSALIRLIKKSEGKFFLSRAEGSLIYAVVQRRMLLFCCQKNGNDKVSESELIDVMKFKTLGSGDK